MTKLEELLSCQKTDAAEFLRGAQRVFSGEALSEDEHRALGDLSEFNVIALGMSLGYLYGLKAALDMRSHRASWVIESRTDRGMER